MTQTQTHPNRQNMRDRAQALIASFDALPAPKTLVEIMRTARALMLLDRMLSQFWKEPANARTRTPSATPEAADVPAAEQAPQTVAPLNRQQRRALEAKNKSRHKAVERQSGIATGIVMPQASGQGAFIDDCDTLPRTFHPKTDPRYRKFSEETAPHALL